MKILNGCKYLDKREALPVKIGESKRYFVLFFTLGFLAGILYANLLSKDYIASLGIFNDYFLEQYTQTEVDAEQYFWYVLKLRAMPVIVLGALGCTRIRKGAAAAFLLWTGFSGGIMLTAAVMKMGVKGIILCLIGLTPQFIFYVAAFLILLWFLFSYPQTRWNLSKTTMFGLLMIIGIILECYINPVLMKLFIGTL